MLICWYPVSVSRKGIPSDHRGRYLPGKLVGDYLERAVTYYYLKKDKNLQNRFKKEVLKRGVEKIDSQLYWWLKKEVALNYPVLEGSKIPEKIYIDCHRVSKELIKFFNGEEKGFIRREWREVFSGVVEESGIQFPDWEKIKIPVQSYSRALGEYLHKLVKKTQLEGVVAEVQNQIANNWEISLLLGEWTTPTPNPLFLHLWSIKELREKLQKENPHFFPKILFYIPRLNLLTGWSQLEPKGE
ncbi:MAG: hypothetical protein C6I01_00260 [Epsilonproteobacteria bacterium]|jgi:hypothetical protein|nr:hypothetical protein [Campylobacterota bacterium]NPA88675.1 hypothetical protein [Campylobacterota bacterium]